jgi:hypothetical protein
MCGTRNLHTICDRNVSTGHCMTARRNGWHHGLIVVSNLPACMLGGLLVRRDTGETAAAASAAVAAAAAANFW